MITQPTTPNFAPPLSISDYGVFRPGFLLARILLSIFLLTAAAFKAHALGNATTSPSLILLPPRWQVALVEVEVLLALWLLSGVYLRGAWLVSVMAFGVFGGLSCYQGVAGQPSCGCFGNLVVSPWLAFVGDLGALAALFYWRPRLTRRADLVALAPSRYRPVVLAGLPFLGVAAVCLSVLLLSNGRTAGLLAALRGEALTVEPGVTDIGVVASREPRFFQITLRNHTDRPIRIIGGTSDCSCMATQDLPAFVDSRQEVSLQIRFRSRGTGSFRRSFVLMTDDASQREVIATVTGQLTDESE